MIIIGCGTTDPENDKWEWMSFTDFGRIPHWSPDGSCILFGDDRLGDPQSDTASTASHLWIWTPGEDPIPLTDSLPPHNWDYHWSPDGEKIGFTSPGEAGAPDAGIWIVDISDGSKTKLFDRGKDLSWNFDGSAIAVRVDQPRIGSPGIYLIYFETDEQEFIADGFHPVCSPLEPSIVFSEREISGRLFIVNAEHTQIELPCTGAFTWSWSADGYSIFSSVNNYTMGVFEWNILKIVLNNDEWQAMKLATWAANPAPDRTGSRFAFQRISGSSYSGLWLNTSKGNERIADYGYNPEFSPTADRIAVNASNGGIRILERKL